LLLALIKNILQADPQLIKTPDNNFKGRGEGEGEGEGENLISILFKSNGSLYNNVRC
jgi:hypothetical protein